MADGDWLYRLSHELAFVAGLGTWRENVEETDARTLRLLRAYRDALDKRSRWWRGKTDPLPALKAAVEARIADIQAKRRAA